MSAELLADGCLAKIFDLDLDAKVVFSMPISMAVALAPL
jgi:hypothetical protein